MRTIKNRLIVAHKEVVVSHFLNTNFNTPQEWVDQIDKSTVRAPSEVAVPSELAEVTSSMGTSTALGMNESSTDQLYDKVFDEFRSYLVWSEVLLWKI